MDDYYQILGVSKSASQDEIKTAYRKLASKHHPDKGGDAELFKKIQVAYDNVGSPDKRAAYDNPAPQGGFHFHQGGIPPGFEEIFGSMFGNMFGHNRQAMNRNRTLNLQTLISLEEAFYGKELVATINLPSGRESIINVKIPPGVSDGMVLRLREIGDDSVPSAPRGDIHLSVSIAPHNKFLRQGDDLISILEVDAINAILGCSVNMDTIDNKTISVTVAPGTQHDTVLAAQGYGMPNINDAAIKGRLLLKVNIKIPTSLTEPQKELLRQIKY